LKRPIAVYSLLIRSLTEKKMLIVWNGGI